MIHWLEEERSRKELKNKRRQPCFITIKEANLPDLGNNKEKDIIVMSLRLITTSHQIFTCTVLSKNNGIN